MSDRDAEPTAAGRALGEAVAPKNRPDEETERNVDAPARFSLLYESGDGRLCVFEDAEGHLSAVDARRFA